MNVDALHVHPRRFHHAVGDVDDALLAFAPHPRPNVDEGIALQSGGIGHRLDGIVDQLGIVLLALEGLNQRPQIIRIEIANFAFHVDVAEVVKLTLLDGEGDVEIFLVVRQLGHRRDDPEVGIALGQIELPQLFAVVGQAIGIIGIVRGQEPPPTRLPGRDLAAQITGGKTLVADKIDFRDSGFRAFGNLEHQINAVLRQLDHLGLDLRRKAPRAPIKFQNALHVGAHLGAGVDGARLDPHFLAEFFIIKLLVAFKGQPVDDGILHHIDSQHRIAAGNGHVGKKAGGEQRF